MEWYEIVLSILGGLGTFLGGGWLMSIYSAKPKKTSIEIDNMKKVIDELQEVIVQLQNNSKIYRTDTDQTIKELKLEVKELSTRVDIKHDAISAAYKCDLIKEEDECIVLKTFKEKCKECKIYNK